MSQKNINGDLNVTGAYKQNGTALTSGTQWYKHTVTITTQSSDIGIEDAFVILSTTPNTLDLNAIVFIGNYGKIPSYISDAPAIMIQAPVIYSNGYSVDNYCRYLGYTDHFERTWRITMGSSPTVKLVSKPTVNLTTGEIERTETSVAIDMDVTDVVTSL